MIVASEWYRTGMLEGSAIIKTIKIAFLMVQVYEEECLIAKPSKKFCLALPAFYPTISFTNFLT